MLPKGFIVACGALVGAGVGVGVGLGAGAAGATAGTPPRARLQKFVCQTALDPPARGIQVIAVMRPVAGTDRMQLKFQLRRKAHGSAAASVSGGDLGKWRSPTDASLGREPGDVWNLRKQVVNLPAPAVYRFLVSFRWLGARSRVLGVTERLSPSCDQPELRPDLQVSSIAVQPVQGSPGQDTYTAMIRNGGRTGAGPFQVQFSDAGVITTRTISRLGPGARRSEDFIGAACSAANAATVVVDPAHVVDDYDRANNSRTVTCPEPAGGQTAPATLG
jgi:CARDB